MIEEADIKFTRAEADKLVTLLNKVVETFSLKDGGVAAQDAVMLFKKIDEAFLPKPIEQKLIVEGK
jgi:hypothetical protein